MSVGDEEVRDTDEDPSEVSGAGTFLVGGTGTGTD